MLFNHELVRKLRYGAAGIAAFLSGYAVLAFRDQHINTTQLVLILSGLLVVLICSWLMKKAGKPVFFVYAGSMVFVLAMLLFRMRANIALDLTLLALATGVSIALWLQIRKKNEFA
jgi:Na+/melibiose symporter-like transporter